MASHGKKARIWIETTPGGGTKPPASTPTGYTALTTAHTFRLGLAKDLAESSSFGSEDHTNESGLKGGSVSFDARFTAAIASVLLAAYNSDLPVNVVSRPEGDASTKQQYFANYHIESIEIGASIGDVVSLSGSFKRDGAVTVGNIA